MFDIYCPQHGSRVLLDVTALESIDDTDAGLAVHYHCTCGYEGVWVTGHKAAASA
jgi:hypothetical protein